VWDKKREFYVPFYLQTPKNGGSGRIRQFAYPIPI
jgi:hypothetical protein